MVNTDVRIALLYPPPWKLDASEQTDFGEHGAPDDYQSGDLDGDFFQTPYGLLSLGAQARRAGHQVKLYNLSGVDWRVVDELISNLEADLWGMSCWTANRRGTALVADIIRTAHPKTHIVVGGPHSTPLGKELLEHHPSIDTATKGEGETSFMELIDRLENGNPTTGIAGTWYRHDGQVHAGGKSPNINDLDELAPPHSYYRTHLMMTSRGCPWACTFCGAESSWGRGFRSQTTDYVLDNMQQALSQVPRPMLLIKDDTFTTNNKRVMALCQGIRARKMNFLWSCDTRVDVLTDDLCREMRLAGCERMSLGVESGSTKILEAVNKKITKEKILEATSIAKKYGIKVRYFMMLGNRGETRETFNETLRFLKEAAPHSYVFSCLSIYPGTQDYDMAVEQGWLDSEQYFTGNFQELKVPFDSTEEDTQYFSEWFAANKGIQYDWQPSVEECTATVALLPGHAPALMDLAGAQYSAGNYDAAEQSLKLASETGYPLPGLVHNYHACIAYQRGQVDVMKAQFETAVKLDPGHYVLLQNINAAKKWMLSGRQQRGEPLELNASHEFQLLERTLQPSLPGPLPLNAADWNDEPIDAPPNAEASVIDKGKRLKVLL
ncbi:MAG: radical SAM protein [Polyangiaceae bacterium]|nr:radical SAM protein [Polyangiaceae bacterium]